MKKGVLIVFTGIDGSGKTTQAKLLVENLKKEGINAFYVWCRWEPFLLRSLIRKWKKKSTDSNEIINNEVNDLKKRKNMLLNNSFFRWLWLISFFIDYGIQIFLKVRLKLLKGKLIISDRVFFDSIIDQAINLGKRGKWLLSSLDSSWIKLIFPEPNKVIYVDCPEDIAFSRKKDAPNIGYLMERRKLYLELAERYEWLKIDGTLPVNEIALLIKDKIYKGINTEEISD